MDRIKAEGVQGQMYRALAFASLAKIGTEEAFEESSDLATTWINAPRCFTTTKFRIYHALIVEQHGQGLELMRMVKPYGILELEQIINLRFAILLKMGKVEEVAENLNRHIMVDRVGDQPKQC